MSVGVFKSEVNEVERNSARCAMAFAAVSVAIVMGRAHAQVFEKLSQFIGQDKTPKEKISTPAAPKPKASTPATPKSKASTPTSLKPRASTPASLKPRASTPASLKPKASARTDAQASSMSEKGKFNNSKKEPILHTKPSTPIPEIPPSLLNSPQPTPLPSSTDNAPTINPQHPPVPPKESTPRDFENVRILLEGTGGWVFATPSETLRDFKPKVGLNSEALVLADVEIDQIIYQAGIGVFFSTPSGVEPIFTPTGARAKDGNNNDMSAEISIRYFGTGLNLGASWRLHPDVSLGPALQLRNPSDRSYSSLTIRRSTAVLLGGQIGFDFDRSSLSKRLVLRGMRSVNNIDWSDFHLLIGFQIGLPVSTLHSNKDSPSGSGKVSSKEPIEGHP